MFPICLCCSRTCSLRCVRRITLQPGELGEQVPSRPARQHTSSQQWELGTAIHAPFNQFEPVHMPFDWTSTPRQGQSCQHRRFVWLDPFGKRLQLGQVARCYLTQPGVQLLSCLLPDHVQERLCQPVSSLCAWTGLPDQRQFFLLPLVQLLWLTHKQPGDSLCREVFQRCRRPRDALALSRSRWGRLG
jgi:hypothetical protein